MAGPLTADVLVLGGGPAGSTLAARLAQLGHDVVLVERLAFPRRRLGESLTPGVLPLLEPSGARAAVEVAGGLRPVDEVAVGWEDGPRVRRDPPPHGAVADRGSLDRVLLEHAASLGVRVLQPARVASRRREGGRWSLVVEHGGRPRPVTATLLADAGGRGGALQAARTPTGARTLALHGYWRACPDGLRPTVEALDDAWCWAVPLPDGMVNVLVFVDPARLTGPRAPLEQRYRALIAGSSLAQALAGARLDGPVRAADATPYLEREPVGDGALKVGDAALALDPISSSGVQRSLQTSLAAAVVVNTALRRPDAAGTAYAYYRDALAHASERHRVWAGEHYAVAAAARPGPFWARRAGAGPPRRETAPERAGVGPDRPVGLAPQVAFVELPCLAGDFVELRTAVAHPRLAEPVAYLGGWELAPLLRRVPARTTCGELVRSWAGLVPRETGVAIAAWLARNELLVPAGAR